MNKAASWNINGVGFDAREAAREAARRQGKSLGEWLHGVIADHASEMGVEADAFGGQDRIDAVTARLEGLSRRPDAGFGRADRDGLDDGADRHDRPASNRGHRAADRMEAAFDDDRDSVDESPRFRHSDREMRLAEKGRDRARDMDRNRRDLADGGRRAPSRAVADDNEFLLEDAIDAMERRAQHTERKTDMALASVAKIIDATESKRDDEREMFSALSRKLSDMEARITSRVSDDATRPIKGALARVEARLDTLGRRNRPEASPLFASVAAASLEPVRAATEEPMLRLESKLNSILDAIVAKPAGANPVGLKPMAEPMQTSAYALSAAQAYPATDRFDPAPPIAPPPFANRRLGEAVADIANFQRALDRGANGIRRPATDAAASPNRTPPEDAGNGLQSDIAGLSAKVEDMRRELIARTSAPAAAPAETANSQVDRLRDEVAGMAKLLRDITPQHSVQGQIARMTAAVEEMRRDVSRREAVRVAETTSHRDLAGVKAEVAALSRTLKQLAPRDHALPSTIGDPADRIDTAREPEARGAAPKADRDDIVGELRRWLADIDPRATIGELEREVRTIGDKLDDLSGVDATALGRIQHQTEEIRDLLSAAAHPLAVERIEQQVATLAEKIDRRPHLSGQDDHAFRATANDLRLMLENTPGTALFDKIERQLEALTAKVDQAVHEASGARKVAEGSRQHFDQIQQDLAARFDTFPPETRTDRSSLESLVRDLSQRIEAARAPDANGHALEALQEQIGRLAGRFDRSEGELSALSSIERSMHGLFAHLEETRASVEAVAAKAARDATSAALSRNATDPVTARELATLKAIQAEADERTHQTLNAVHDTLGRVVDRLSLMEQDGAGQANRPAAMAARAASETRAEAERPAAGRPSARDDRHPAAALPDLVLDDPHMLDTPLFGRAKARGAAPVAARGAADLDDDSGRSDFIAAARRAARTAQHDPSVLALKRNEAPAAAADLRAGLMAKTRDYVASHKKPVLLGLAAVLVILGTLAVMGSLPGGNGAEQLAVRSSAAAPKARLVEAAPARTGQQTTGRPINAGRATMADLSPSALPSAPPPASDALPGSDPVTTGSIQKLPSFAAQPAGTLAPAAPTGALKEMATNGNAAAQYEIASRFAEGRLLAKDLTAAAGWYEKAAQQGLAPAQYKLASLYEKGLGVQKDRTKARIWYVKAAEAGNPRAMHNLAVLVADGDGKPDYVTAVTWFRKAADYGVHDSQYNLGILLARGLGTPQSLVQAYQWFAVAAKQNDADATLKRDEVAAKLAPNDLAVAQALAAAFHPKTADMAATEIEAPPGGWDGAAGASLGRSARPKLSLADAKTQEASRY